MGDFLFCFKVVAVQLKNNLKSKIPQIITNSLLLGCPKTSAHKLYSWSIEFTLDNVDHGGSVRGKGK